MIQCARINQLLVGQDLSRADWHHRCGASPPQLSSGPLGGIATFETCSLNNQYHSTPIIQDTHYEYETRDCKKCCADDSFRRDWFNQVQRKCANCPDSRASRLWGSFWGCIYDDHFCLQVKADKNRDLEPISFVLGGYAA